MPGSGFAVTSGRPPRAMEMLVEPLALTTPLAAFNGGMFVDDAMHVLSQRTIPDAAVAPVLDLFEHRGLDAWIYRGADWLVRRLAAPHVDQEAGAVRFRPTVVADYGDILATASHGEASLAKIVGVSDDLELVARVAAEARELIGHHASVARSQTYYLDVTHPDANKGAVVDHLCRTLGIPAAEVCKLGDMPNDVLMFARSGLSIAMGNADREVQRAARYVTRPNTDNGFAHAVERYVLPAQTDTPPTAGGVPPFQRTRPAVRNRPRLANSRPRVSTQAGLGP